MLDDDEDEEDEEDEEVQLECMLKLWTQMLCRLMHGMILDLAPSFTPSSH